MPHGDLGNEPGSYDSPITINTGGTYSGNWEATGVGQVAVTITTTQPVTIENSYIKFRDGEGIYGSDPATGLDVTVRNCRFIGVYPGGTDRRLGRCVHLDGTKRFIFENNWAQFCATCLPAKFVGGATDPIHIRFNRFRDINAAFTDGSGGFKTADFPNGRDLEAAIQLHQCSNVRNIEIAWNEVINTPLNAAAGTGSRMEDTISMHESSGHIDSPAQIHHNLCFGAYPALPGQGYSGGGIMCADGINASLARAAGSVRCHTNVVLGSKNYGIAIATGFDSRAFDNLVIGSGYDELESADWLASNVGVYVWDWQNDPAWADNFAFNNEIMFWDFPDSPPGGGREDTWFPNCDPDTSCVGNISLSPAGGNENSRPAYQDELDAYNNWLNVTVANAGVNLGPQDPQLDTEVNFGIDLVKFASVGYVDSVGDPIGWDPDVFDYLVTPVGAGLVSVDSGASQTLQSAVLADPTGIYRMEGVFNLVGEVIALQQPGFIFGAPLNEGGCEMRGSVTLDPVTGWTNEGNGVFSRQLNFPRLPNHGTPDGNLQAGADAAHGMPEQVWVDAGALSWTGSQYTPLTPVTTMPGGTPPAGLYSISFNGTNGPHTLRISVGSGNTPAIYSDIQFARAFPNGNYFYFAGSNASGSIYNIRFSFAAVPLFRAVNGAFQSLAENGLVRDMHYKYCESQYITSGTAFHIASGWTLDRCLVSDVGQSGLKGRMQRDNGEMNGTLAEQELAMITNNKIMRCPTRRVKVGTEGGAFKINKMVGGMHFINNWVTEIFGDGAWWDNDSDNPNFLVQSNLIHDIAKFGIHIEICNPPSGQTGPMLVRYNDVFDTGTNNGVPNSNENQINGDGGACYINSSSHHVRAEKNRFVASTQSAYVLAAHTGRQGITGSSVIDNNLGRASGVSAAKSLVQRTFTGGPTNEVTINQNDHWVPGSGNHWNTFDGTSSTNRNFTQWQGIGNDLSGTAGNTGDVPVPSGFVPFTTKHYGRISTSITGGEQSRQFLIDSILQAQKIVTFDVDMHLNTVPVEISKLFSVDMLVTEFGTTKQFNIDMLLLSTQDIEFKFDTAKNSWLFGEATLGRVGS